MTGPAPIESDADARSSIQNDLDDTLVVEAAAGTGKTTELIKRVLRVLATGRADMVEIVAVTFTEKAAGELKLRLREGLEVDRAAATDKEVRLRLERALQTLEEAHVNTIHGFCAELLRERPVEASVDPLFTVLTEPQADRLYDRAFDTWLKRVLESPPEGVRRALRRTGGMGFGTAARDDGPVGRLRGAGRTLKEWREFPAAWIRPPFDRAEEIESLISALHVFAGLTASPASDHDTLFLDTDGIRRLSQQIRLEQGFGHRDLDGWESRLIDLMRDWGLSRTRKGRGYAYSKDVKRTDVLAARDDFWARIQQFKREADADLAASLQAELAGATAEYQTLKQAAGALDYADLLGRTRDVIRGNVAVRTHLQSKFRRIFVDEFQDTDPVQAEILMLLSADNPNATDWTTLTPVSGKLFVVGDPKQAIYRFRGADVGTYWRVRDQVRVHGGRVLQLTTNFRSVPEIQRFVNSAFAGAMVADARTLQADYVPLAPSRLRVDTVTQPAIVALPVPKPYSGRGPLKASPKAIEESLPDAVGAFIAWLVDEKNGWRVQERQPDGSERSVAIQPKHIGLLFRRFVSFGVDVTRRYVDAIEARNIPHLLVGGKSFHGREEVETIRAALSAIEWPDDELSVFAALKGSLFAIDDEALLEFRHRWGAFHPFRIPKELGGNSGQELALTGEPTAHLEPIADALRVLQSLHRHRNYRPVADTVGRLLTETRAHVGFVLRPAGEQALANVLHVAELARQYEAGGGISFRGFIDELTSAAELEGAEAPIVEESSDGVRLMTVHKAKGLEFPVVILADLTCRLSRGDASRYLDAAEGLCAVKIGGWAPHDLHIHEAEEVARDEAEGIRLAYVAATRARDLLIVPALGDAPWEGGWFSLLNQALYPPMASRRQSSKAPGCPTFRSKDSVLERPGEEPAGPATVCPGQHHFTADGYSAAWWEPGPGGGLELGVQPPFGVRREELIVRDVPRQVVDDGRATYDRWRLARAEALAAGSTRSIVVETARARSLVDMPAETIDPSAVSIVHAQAPVLASMRRLGGPSFGVLVHAILALAPLSAGRTALDVVAGAEARILGLSDADAEAAADAAERVLAHELLARARRAEARDACRRETPVSFSMGDGCLVEGVVDLAFEEDGAWTVVDYKTDRDFADAGEAQYRRQVAIYVAAIARATGMPTSGVLLRV